MKAQLIKFEISFGIWSELVKAKDFDDLLDNRMQKRQLKSWQSISWIDADDNFIDIHRHFIDDEGMTRREAIDDSLANQEIVITGLQDHNLFLERAKSKS